jgi:hypothetical protein
MPAKVTVSVDGTEFDAITVQFGVSTEKDQAGIPMNQTLQTQAKIWVDAHDTKNFPFGSIKKLFELANVPDDTKQKEMKISYWKDDRKENAICTYSFKGWINKFDTYTPVPITGDTRGGPAVSGGQHYNTIVYLELQPIINKSNHQEVTIGN